MDRVGSLVEGATRDWAEGQHGVNRGVEAIELILGICGCIFDALAVGLDGFELVAWLMSRDSRRARRRAKWAGEPLPPLSKWGLAFRLLIPVAIIMTGLLIWKWVRPGPL